MPIQGSFFDIVDESTARAAGDYTIAGTDSNGNAVIIAECRQFDITGQQQEAEADNTPAPVQPEAEAPETCQQADDQQQEPEAPAAAAGDPDSYQGTPAQIQKIIDLLAGFDGLRVSVLGCWIWVTGDTKPNKEALKGLGFWWSKGKNAWYKKPDSLNRPRGKYRSQYKNFAALTEHWETAEA